MLKFSQFVENRDNPELLGGINVLEKPKSLEEIRYVLDQIAQFNTLPSNVRAFLLKTVASSNDRDKKILLGSIKSPQTRKLFYDYARNIRSPQPSRSIQDAEDAIGRTNQPNDNNPKLDKVSNNLEFRLQDPMTFARVDGSRPGIEHAEKLVSIYRNSDQATRKRIISAVSQWRDTEASNHFFNQLRVR
jgi:hypothetical protein